MWFYATMYFVGVPFQPRDVSALMWFYATMSFVGTLANIEK